MELESSEASLPAEKRVTIEGPAEKRLTTEGPLIQSGIAAIKTEYVISPSQVSQCAEPNSRSDSKKRGRDDTETIKSEPPPAKKRRRGQNKHRPRAAMISFSEMLCPNYYMHGGKTSSKCLFKEKCRYMHNVAKFMSEKPPDLGDKCYMFELYGKCTYGLACRYAGSHVTPDLVNTINEDLYDANRPNAVCNLLSKELQETLRKRRYNFIRSEEYLKKLGESRTTTTNVTPAVLPVIEDKSSGNSEEQVFPTGNIGESCPTESIGKSFAVESTIDSCPADKSCPAEKTGESCPKENTVESCPAESTSASCPADNTSVSCPAENTGRSENTVESCPAESTSASCPAEITSVSCPTENTGRSENTGESCPNVNTSVSCPAENTTVSCPNENIGNSTSSDGCKSSGALTDEDEVRLKQSEKKKIDFKGKLFLAPLTTTGNLPFRRICKEFGADITCGEMAMCTNLLQAKQSEWALLKRHKSEDLFGVQVCGSHADTMTKCAELLNSQASVDFVDINTGCPIDLVFKKGAGSALLRRHTRFEGIVRGMLSVLDCPLTVKMRASISKNNWNGHKLVPKLRDWGVSLITVHGRSREQRYTKQADWDYISRCAQAADPVPLFGNGDILSFEDYNHFCEKSEVAGCMIARGALIKPWIFTEIKEQRHWDIRSSERLEILRRYTNYGLEHWGSDSQGVENTRKFLLEWLSFLYRYIPVGVLESVPQKINQRPPSYVGRDDLETMMNSNNCKDWIKISEMLLGPVPENFTFLPKHKANSYS